MTCDVFSQIISHLTTPVSVNLPTPVAFPSIVTGKNHLKCDTKDLQVFLYLLAEYHIQYGTMYKRPENRVHLRNSAIHKIMHCYLGPILPDHDKRT